MKNLLVVIVFYGIYFCSLLGQQVYVLDLETSLEIALEKSHNIRTLREQLLGAEYQLEAVTNQYKTTVNLYLNGPNYSETISEFEDSIGIYYSPIKRFSLRTGLTVNQYLPTDGFIYLRLGGYNIQDYYQKKQITQLNTRIGITQPIESFYGFNKLKTEIQQAELNYELSKKKLLRSELDLKYIITQNFYYLISVIELEKIAKQTMVYQKDAFELAQSKYIAGLIPEVEALQMEIDLAEAINNYDISKINRTSQENTFKQLLGLNIKDSLIIQWHMHYEPVQVDVEKAVKLGLANCPEVQEKKIDIELAKINLKKQKLGEKITGSISAFYDITGIGENNLSVGLYSTYYDAINYVKNKPGDKGITIDVSIPIWNSGVTKAQVEATKSNLRVLQFNLSNEIVTIDREIREIVNRLETSMKRLLLLEKNVIVAEKSYEISKQRFSKGEINSQSLALDRNRLSQAHISRLEAYIDYKLLLADLSRKTFYDYEKNCPIKY